MQQHSHLHGRNHPVVQWLPLLRKIAIKLEDNPSERDDLVQDTLVNALAHWGTYDPANKLSGWLSWRMRAVLAHKRRRAGIKTIAMGEREHSTPAAQESAIIAADALSRLGNSREEIMLVRYAAGTPLSDMAKEEGVSREMISKITQRARTNFGKRIGYKRAA